MVFLMQRYLYTKTGIDVCYKIQYAGNADKEMRWSLMSLNSVIDGKKSSTIGPARGGILTEETVLLKV